MNNTDSISEYLLNTGVLEYLQDNKMCIHMFVFSQGQVNLCT